MTEHPTHEDAVAKLAELAADIRIAMLTTVDDGGALVSRPMAQQEVKFDGDLWFFAERDSATVAHVTGRPQANVSLTSNDTWVSLHGSVAVVDDRAKAHELWNKIVEAWFPEGPDDANVVLLKFTADGAEYWDTPGGRVASVLSLAKAKVTGEPYSGGENETVQL